MSMAIFGWRAAVGVKVLRFSIGFGTPPLVRWHDRHGTEFVIALIPLGGYVKMLDEREAPVDEAQYSQCFNRKTVGSAHCYCSCGARWLTLF